MREQVAKCLSIDPGRVNIKGKTTEKLGFLGREEGHCWVCAGNSNHKNRINFFSKVFLWKSTEKIGVTLFDFYGHDGWTVVGMEFLGC